MPVVPSSAGIGKAGAVAALSVPGRAGTVLLTVMLGAVLGSGKPKPTTSTAPTATFPVAAGLGKKVRVVAVWPVTIVGAPATVTTPGSTNVKLGSVDVRTTGTLTA